MARKVVDRTEFHITVRDGGDLAVDVTGVPVDVEIDGGTVTVDVQGRGRLRIPLVIPLGLEAVVNRVITQRDEIVVMLDFLGEAEAYPWMESATRVLEVLDERLEELVSDAS